MNQASEKFIITFTIFNIHAVTQNHISAQNKQSLKLNFVTQRVLQGNNAV